MPSEAPLNGTQTEKPQHYMYLKEFRTQQCPLFVQHKCSQHRPYTCFHWHFLNQRRRRPVKKRDGAFNYSPDIYCTKYDETTGICPEGDECPFLHRTAGDTERRYHLRYYKTGTCVYETDSRGHCVKNGPHCAFAHGASDLRPPVLDKSDVHGIELLEKAHDTSALNTASASPSNSSLIEKEKMPIDDPTWNDTSYVLANYKTEPCKRPPRLCRQGYACPHFHNSRDRRRSPKHFKYRSTPCPNVKHGDEWCDPTQCENGDNCVYCHTRTEQQFHPEIYKSTKCNDMVQTNSCPRGPFCAFAHVEHEMTSDRDLLVTPENSLAAFVTSALPNTSTQESAETHSEKEQNGKTHQCKLPDPIGKERSNSNNFLSLGVGTLDTYKGRSGSVSSSISSDFGSGHSYHKAPGSEREDSNVKLRQQLQSIENDPSLDNAEKARRKESLILQHSMGAGGSLGIGSQPLYSPVGQSPVQGLGLGLSTMSPHAPAFYPPGNTVESVVGIALDDLSMEDFDITSIDRELDRERDNDSISVSSSLSAPLSTTGAFGSSGPIGIPPGTLQQRGSISSLSQSPPSPFGSLPLSNQPLQLHRDAPYDQSSSPLLGHSVLGKYHNAHGFSDNSIVSSQGAGPQSPSLFLHLNQHASGGGASHNGTSSELQKMKDELSFARSKMAEWEGVYNQAKCACEAWRKEAEECTRRAKAAEEEKLMSLKQRDEALAQVQRLCQDGSFNPYCRLLRGAQEMGTLPVEVLQQRRKQIQKDLNSLDQLIQHRLQQHPISNS